MAVGAMVAAQDAMSVLLDAHQQAVAQVSHAHWVARLGAVSGLEDCAAVAALQAQRGLPVDGILAPPTRAVVRGEEFAWATGETLLAGGVQHRLPPGLRSVAPSHAHGLSLAETSCARPRTADEQQRLDLLVLHWDECISSLHCFHTLLWRGLSAHLLLDADGTIFQTLDLKRSCAFHARTHNPRSVGIEVNNALYPRAGDGREVVCEPRAHTEAHWHVAGFTQAQHDAIALLVPWLCELLEIPAKMPKDGEQVSSGLISMPYRGVVGHFHLQKDKVDPGFSLWPTLEKAVGP